MKLGKTNNSKVYQNLKCMRSHGGVCTKVHPYISSPSCSCAVHHFTAYTGTVHDGSRRIGCASFFVADEQDIVGPAKGADQAHVPGSKERGFANVIEFFKGLEMLGRVVRSGIFAEHPEVCDKFWL